MLVLAACLALAACDRGGRGGDETPRDFQGVMAEARRLAAAGQQLQAAALLRGAVDSFTTQQQGASWEFMADLYGVAGANSKCLEAARKAVDLGVRTPEALYSLGESLRRLQQTEEAGKVLTELVENHPEHFAGRLALARLRFRVAEPADALPLFEAYFRQAPRDHGSQTTARLEYGRALRGAGRNQEAADQFVTLLEAEPTDAALYSELSMTFFRMGLREQGKFLQEIYRNVSQRAFDEFVEDKLRASGEAAFALSQEALNRERQARYLDAFRGHRRALKIDQQDPRIRLYHAQLCRRFRRFREALAVIEDGVRRGVRPASALWWLRAGIELDQEDAKSAVSSARRSLEVLEAEGDLGGYERGQAEPFVAHLLCIGALLEAGQLDEAGEMITTAAATWPQAWEPAYWRGRLLLEKGEAQMASAAFGEMDSRGAPRSFDLDFYRALAKARLGKRQEAFQDLFRLGQENPSHLPLYDELLPLAPDAEQRRRLAELQARSRALAAEEEELETRLQETPLEESGRLYHDLGLVHVQARKPTGYTFLMLAHDLEPERAETIKHLLGGVRRSEDVFVRLRLLRRLLGLEPRNAEALRGLASIYLQLHAKLDEAARFAARYQEEAPGPMAYRLQAEIALARERRADAVAMLREALERHPEDEELEALLRRASGGGE